jgi:hypothetical protein
MMGAVRTTGLGFTCDNDLQVYCRGGAQSVEHFGIANDRFDGVADHMGL